MGIAWITISAFARIAHHPRATHCPLTPIEAWGFIDEWLDAPVTGVPGPGRGHPEIFSAGFSVPWTSAPTWSAMPCLLTSASNTAPDGGADSDFARFTEIDWFNPVKA